MFQKQRLLYAKDQSIIMRLHLSAEITFQDRNKKNGYLSDTDTNLVGINPKFTLAP